MELADLNRLHGQQRAEAQQPFPDDRAQELLQRLTTYDHSDPQQVVEFGQFLEEYRRADDEARTRIESEG